MAIVQIVFVMSGYKKYNGLDYRPKFSSSDKGMSREAHYVLGKVFGTKRRKADITFEDINEVCTLLLAIIALIFLGLYKFIMWLYKKTKILIGQYRNRRKRNDNNK